MKTGLPFQVNQIRQLPRALAGRIEQDLASRSITSSSCHPRCHSIKFTIILGMVRVRLLALAFSPSQGESGTLEGNPHQALDTKGQNRKLHFGTYRTKAAQIGSLTNGIYSDSLSPLLSPPLFSFPQAGELTPPHVNRGRAFTAHVGLHSETRSRSSSGRTRQAPRKASVLGFKSQPRSTPSNSPSAPPAVAGPTLSTSPKKSGRHDCYDLALSEGEEDSTQFGPAATPQVMTYEVNGHPRTSVGQTSATGKLACETNGALIIAARSPRRSILSEGNGRPCSRSGLLRCSRVGLRATRRRVGRRSRLPGQLRFAWVLLAAWLRGQAPLFKPPGRPPESPKENHGSRHQ